MTIFTCLFRHIILLLTGLECLATFQVYVVSEEPFSWQIGSGDWFIPSLPCCFRTQILFADWNPDCPLANTPLE